MALPDIYDVISDIPASYKLTEPLEDFAQLFSFFFAFKALGNPVIHDRVVQEAVLEDIAIGNGVWRAESFFKLSFSDLSDLLKPLKAEFVACLSFLLKQDERCLVSDTDDLVFRVA